jgi:CrcB protein
MNYALIIIGGGLGSLFRYLTAHTVNNLFHSKFLFGTIVVNCVGALLIGILMSVFEAFSVNVRWKMFLVIGFLGGYTTFSAYSYETVKYFLDGDVKYALLNIALSNVLCIAFVFLGIWLSRVTFLAAFRT